MERGTSLAMREFSIPNAYTMEELSTKSNKKDAHIKVLEEHKCLLEESLKKQLPSQ